MTTCNAEPACSCKQVEDGFLGVSDVNTLAFNAALCVNCGMCCTVCPHGVFAYGEQTVRIVQAAACMECGACERNCPTGALVVDSGVGCAAAMIYAALTGKAEPTCGGPEPEGCCG